MTADPVARFGEWAGPKIVDVTVADGAQPMASGTIKKVMKDRGFGFIRTADGKEVFFHRSECRALDFEHIEQGQTVDFDEENDPKGPRARNVRVAAGH